MRIPSSSSMLSFFSLSFLLFFVFSVSSVFAGLAAVWQTDDQQRLAQLSSLPVYENSSNCSAHGKADEFFLSLSLNSSDFSSSWPLEGFGAALTESAAFSLARLRDRWPHQYSLILRELFSNLSISFLRIPLSSCDFNAPDELPTFWSVDDRLDDFRLESLHQNIDSHYSRYSMTILLDIIKLYPHVKLIGSPWTAPFWLKNSFNATFGSLREESFIVPFYARLLVETIFYFYTEYGICFWGLTLQNEPLFEPFTYSGMLMNSSQALKLGDFIQTFLKQKILEISISQHYSSDFISYLQSFRLLAFDHNWSDVYYPIEIFSQPLGQASFSGVAFHCYQGNPIVAQSLFHQLFPSIPIYLLECTGKGPSQSNPRVFIEDFLNEARLLYFDTLNSRGSMVLHWNLVLDQFGGPVQSPVKKGRRGIINIHFPTESSENFLESPISFEYSSEFYTLAHFAGLLGLPTARIFPMEVLSSSLPSSDSFLFLSSISRDRRVFHLLNNSSKPVAVQIVDETTEQCLETIVNNQTVQSIVVETIKH